MRPSQKALLSIGGVLATLIVATALAGRVALSRSHVAGASDIDLRGVTVTDAEVDLKGASEVVLTMGGGVLSGSTAGAGRLQYHGPVAEERIEVAGITRIVHRGE